MVIVITKSQADLNKIENGGGGGLEPSMTNFLHYLGSRKGVAAQKWQNDLFGKILRPKGVPL